MVKKILNLIKDNWILITVFIFGIFLRVFQAKERFLYSHDQDLAGWFVRDIIENRHLRLIGQETSTQGIYIGALYYYLLVPFYLAFGMDPIGGFYLIAVLGVFSLISIYFVISRIWGRTTALVATVIYGLSYYMVTNDREVVPTMPVIVWTVWYLYCLHLLLSGKQKKGFILLALLISVIWHLNFALVLTIPMALIAFLLARKKLEKDSILSGIIVLFVGFLPLILFEVRHGFSQLKAFVVSMTTHQYDVISGVDKLKRVIHLLSKDVYGLFAGAFPVLKYEYLFYAILVLGIVLVIKKVLDKRWFVILSSWILVYIAFFSSYSKVLSEYYLNGVIVVFIVIVSVAISWLISIRKYSHIAIILVTLFIVFALRQFVLIPINRSGYIERKAIVNQIKNDSQKREYDCVSISFITDPGYEFGYRYFIYLAGLKTKPISEKIPVYTIVFPLKDIFPADTTKGAIGLIYPDYQRYNEKIIENACQGDDSNLTDALWGFPQ